MNEIFVIGGSSLYTAAMTTHKDNCKLIIATRVNKKFECDVNVPDLEKSRDFEPLHVSQTESQDDITFDYCFFGNGELLAKRPDLIPTSLMEKYPKHQEMQYLEIIDEIIQTGKFKNDRTGTGLSLIHI